MQRLRVQEGFCLTDLLIGVAVSVALWGCLVNAIKIVRRTSLAVETSLTNKMSLAQALNMMKRYARLSTSCRKIIVYGLDMLECTGQFENPSTTQVALFLAVPGTNQNSRFELKIKNDVTGNWETKWMLPGIQRLSVCGDADMATAPKCMGGKLETVHVSYLQFYPERKNRFFTLELEASPSLSGSATPVIRTSIFVRNNAFQKEVPVYEF